MAREGPDYPNLMDDIRQIQADYLQHALEPDCDFFMLLLTGEATQAEVAVTGFFWEHWNEIDRMLSASELRCYAVRADQDLRWMSYQGVYEAARELGVPVAALPALVCFARPWYENEIRYLRLAPLVRAGDKDGQIQLWRELTDICVRCAQLPAPRRRALRRRADSGEDPQLAALGREWKRLVASREDAQPSALDDAVGLTDKVARTVVNGQNVVQALGNALG